MSKKMRDGETRKTRPMMGEGAPPLLSEELITKLQAAVNSAKRKHDMSNRVSKDTTETSFTAEDQ